MPTPAPSPTLPRAGLVRTSLAVLAAICAVIGVGTWLTELGAWYAQLRQPPWKPPDTWFGPAWSLFYALIAVAVVRAWRAAPGRDERLQLLWACGVNALLNVAWSGLFFRLRRPDWALAEVLLFWLSIVVMIVVARRCDLVAAWLLVPYLAWVAFAGALNLAVVRLNAPF